MFSNLKIGARLGLAFLSVLILLLAMAFSGITKLHNLQQEIEEIASKRYPEVIGANDIKTTALDNARLVRNTILITDEKRMAAAKADYDKNVTRIGARIDDLEKGMATDEGKRLIAALRQARDTYNAYTGEVMQLALDQKKSEATATLYGEKSKSIGTYVAAVEKVIGFQDAMMKGTVNRSQEAYTSGRNMMLLLGAAAILVAAAIGYAVTRSIMKPLAAMQSTMEQISGTNDFTKRCAVTGNDEISHMMRSFNGLIERLQTVLRTVLANVQHVTEAARSLSAASRQAADSSSQQSRASASMAAAVEEVTVSISSVAENANSAKTLSDESSQTLREGGEIIHRTVSEINSIAEQVHQTAEAITALGKHSDQISGIVLVIKEVADQTNLLALNAAIEAARAGESGRGFAVVADEVRKLAERTTKSTQEISGMIALIQESARSAVDRMGGVVTNVETGRTLGKEAGERIAAIQADTEKVSLAVSDISSALREQDTASQNIAKHVESVAQMTEEGSSAAQQTAEAATQLDRLAGEMTAAVAVFKL